MNKIIFLFVFFLCCSVNGQSRLIPSEIILNTNDTLKVNIKVIVNLFDEKLIKMMSFVKKVKTEDSNGIASFFSAKEIKQLSFTDFEGRKRILKYDGDKQLREIIYDGVIKVFGIFYSNANSSGRDIDIFDETGKRVKVGSFGSSTTALKRVVKNNSILVEIIKKSDLYFDDLAVLILTKYEKEYMNK